MFFFEPLNERVPVYQTPFGLLQEIVLEATPDAEAAFHGRRELTLIGTLEYQACDDKVCFNPAAVPLSWTLKNILRSKESCDTEGRGRSRPSVGGVSLAGSWEIIDGHAG